MISVYFKKVEKVLRAFALLVPAKWENGQLKPRGPLLLPRIRSLSGSRQGQSLLSAAVEAEQTYDRVALLFLTEGLGRECRCLLAGLGAVPKYCGFPY